MAKRATNGAGCFRQYKDGFEYRIQKGYKSNGKPNIINTTGKTKKECREKMQKKLEQLALLPSSKDCLKMTLSELCKKHIEYDSKKIENLEDTSHSRRGVTARNQIDKYDIGKLQVTAITPMDIDRHIEWLISNTSLSLSSIEKTFHAINGAYKWAIAQQMLYFNPCDAVKDKFRHRIKKLAARYDTDAEILVLSDEEVEILKKQATKTYKNGKPVYEYGLGGLFLNETALRCGEYCALRVSDWHRNTHTLLITKTRHRVENFECKENEPKYILTEGPVKNYHVREIVLSEEAERLLEQICKNSGATNPDDYIQVNRRGKPTEPTKFIQSINNIFRKAGLDEGISGSHVFRRSYATRAHNKKADSIDIAAYLGDTEQTVIKHYIATGKKIRIGDKTQNVIPIPDKRHE